MANIKWFIHRKAWLFIALIAMLSVAAFALLSRRDAIPTVQIVRAVRTTLDANVNTNGKVEPIDSQVFRAQFETSITGISVKEGQLVRRGQTLLTLDAGAIRTELGQARVELLAAQDDLRNAREGGPPDEAAQLAGEMQRAQIDVDHLQSRQEILEKLFASGASTKDEVAQNAANLARARSLLDTLQKRLKDFTRRAGVTEQGAALRAREAEEQINWLEGRLHSATATSAIDGTIYSLPHRAGDYVQPGDIVAEMADLHKVRVRAFIDETDLGQLKVNQPVKITWDALPNRIWTGRTEQTPREVVARGTRSVGEVLCSVDNNDLELLPNVNVDVQILVSHSYNALVVPRGAVRSEHAQHYVFILNGDRLYRREISVGIASSSSYEVLSGLNGGDLVALSSDLDLHDGMLVRSVEGK